MNTVKAVNLRLTETVRYAAGVDLPAVDDTVLVKPQRLRFMLETALAGSARRVRVAGALDRRLACIERLDRRWVLADLSGQPHQTRAWPAWTSGHLDLEDPASWLSLATLDGQAIYRLSRPGMVLAAMYLTRSTFRCRASRWGSATWRVPPARPCWAPSAWLTCSSA